MSKTDEKPKAKIDVSPTAVPTAVKTTAEKDAFIERYKRQNPVRYERVKGELEAKFAKL